MKELLGILKEMLEYLWQTKKWWLVPVACLLIIIGALIIASSTAPVPVFVYPLV